MYPGACDRLLRWREAAILELIHPIASPAGPHLVVIEPHMDDAVLSVGRRLVHRRGRCRITILSVVKWSTFTSYLVLELLFNRDGDCLAANLRPGKRKIWLMALFGRRRWRVTYERR
jgi:hypothetical protein